MKRTPWMRLWSWLMVMTLWHSHAGGRELAQVQGLRRDIQRWNSDALARLGAEAPPTRAAVLARKAAARARIQETRAPLLARQAAERARVQALLPALRDAQAPETLAGLADVARALADAAARLPDITDEARLIEEGRRLVFYRETLRGLLPGVEARRALPPAVTGALRAAADALDGLGATAHAVDAASTRAAGRALTAHLAGHVSAAEASARHRRGGLAPHPRWAGHDALDGGPRRAPHLPERRPPAPPSAASLPSAEALLAALDAPTAATHRAGAPIPAPVPADLAPTVDAPHTPAIVAQAEALGGDPRRIFDFVHREVGFRPYAGSMQGAQGTLDAASGNDVDQASLLIALLRAAGHPARYARGTAVLTPGQLLGMTGFSDAVQASSALNTLGMSSILIYQGGALTSVKVSRTWVVAQVPYTNYRGLAGSVDGGGDRQWVSLDPALEGGTLVWDVDLSAGLDWDADHFFSAPTSQSPRELVEDGLRDFILTTGTRCETLDDARARVEAPDDAFDLLPNRPPWTLEGDAVLTPSLASADRHSVALELTDGWGFTVLTHTLSLPEVDGLPVSLTFPAGAGLYSSTSGSVKPSLAVDGALRAQSGAVAAGTEMTLYVSLRAPGQGTWYEDHVVTAGGSYVLNLWNGPVSAARVAAAKARHRALLDAGAPLGQVDLAVAEVAGLVYAQRCHRDEEALYGYAGWRSFTRLEFLTGTATGALSFWGFPAGATREGYQVDAHAQLVSFPLVGARRAETDHLLAELAGYNGSFHEHAVWGEVVGLPAVSTTNLLQLARAEGQPLYTFTTEAEYQAVKSQLSHPAEVLSAVENGLQSGADVIISQRQVVRSGKSMSGYVVARPDGTGAYMISVLHGGSTLDDDGDGGEDPDACGGISSAVNLASGCLTDAVGELHLEVFGRTREIGRAYRVRQSLPSDLGVGWAWTFGERLFSAAGGAPTASGDVVRLRADGVHLRYVRQPDGTYQAPAGERETLRVVAGGWEVANPPEKTWTFGADGRWSAEVDRFGNTLRMVRDASARPLRLETGGGGVILTFTPDSQGRLLTMTDALGRVVRWSYGADGRLATVTRPDGATFTHVYDAAGRMTGRLEPEGVDVAYSFDGQGRLVRHRGADGAEGFFAYDDTNGRSTWRDPTGADHLMVFGRDGRLTERVDPVGNKETWTWQGGRLAERTDARGGKTRWSYDAQGRVVGRVDPEGAQTTWTWDGQGRLTGVVEGEEATTLRWEAGDAGYEVEDPSGRVDHYTFDAFGLVSRIDRADGTTQVWERDAAGRIVRADDGSGQVSTYTHDAVGQIRTVTLPSGAAHTLTYDAAGRWTGLRLPGGGEVGVAYTPWGDLAAITGPDGTTRRYTYQERRLVAETDNLGRSTRYGLDGLGRVREILDPLGRTTRFSLDGAGRVVGMVDPLGNTTEFGFCADVSAEPCDVIDPLGNLTQRELDARGRIVRETTPLGTTRWEYGAAGCASCGEEERPTAVVDVLGRRTELTWGEAGLEALTDALGQVTAYAWSTQGAMTSMVDATGAATTITRDGAGRVLAVVDALGRRTETTWGPDGALASRTRPDGATTTYTWSPYGQIASETFADGTSHTFTWDGAGRLRRALSEAADVEHRYDDGFGRLTDVVHHTLGQSLHLTWDPVTGQRASVTRPDGTLTYRYDPHGRLAALGLPEGGEIVFSYDDFGRLAARRLPNGLTERPLYDGLGRGIGQVVEDSRGQILSGVGFTLDAASRRLTETDLSGRVTRFTYDALDRIVSHTLPDGRVRSYTYDEVGNRLTTSEDGVLQVSYDYDATHRLVGRTRGGVTTTYTYDENGDRVGETGSGTALSWEYDASSRLVREREGGREVASYAFDALGRRVRRSDGAGEVWLLYDGAWPVSEQDADGVLTRSFVFGPGLDTPLVVYDHAGGAPYFLHGDGGGDVVAVSDGAGRIVQQRQFGPFGEVEAETGDSPSDFGFAGKRQDESGRWDFLARSYDPAVGRFLQGDPRDLLAHEVPRSGIAAAMSQEVGVSLAEKVADPQLFHPYTYPGNNPMKWADPSGETAAAAPLAWLFAAALQEMLAAIAAFFLSPFFFWLVLIFLIVAIVLLIVMMAANGNQADTGIMEEAQALVRAGTAASICAALELLMKAAKAACDSAKQQRIKKTQKAKGCRHSRHS